MIIGFAAHATTAHQRQRHRGRHPFPALAMEVVNMRKGRVMTTATFLLFVVLVVVVVVVVVVIRPLRKQRRKAPRRHLL
jgi:hypothetical protein